MFGGHVFPRLISVLPSVASVILFAAFQPSQALAQSPALEKVIEGAKTEGSLKLQWLAGRLDGEAGLRPMIAAMNKRYGTNVKLQYTPGPDFPTMLNKISQEKAAGLLSSTDISLMAASHTAEGLKTGLLRKLDWGSILERPAPSDASINRVAPEGVAVMIASRVIGITYNTNLVKGEDIPASMEDVFKPKWKGKIVSTPFGVGLTQFAAKDLLGYDHMKTYTQRLARHIGGLTATYFPLNCCRHQWIACATSSNFRKSTARWKVTATYCSVISVCSSKPASRSGFRNLATIGWR